MIRDIARAVALATLALMAACRAKPQADHTQSGSLIPAIVAGTPVVARMGSAVVTQAELLDACRRARDARVEDVLARLVDSRLLAGHALAQGAERDRQLHQFRQTAMVQELIDQQVYRRFDEANLPEPVRQRAHATVGFAMAHSALMDVVHALAVVRPNATPRERSAAQSLAERVHATLIALPTPRTIETITAAIRAMAPASALRVEAVEQFDDEGRSPQGTFHPVFARAAADLVASNDVSPLVTTPFGVHVIVLQRRGSALVADPAEVLRREQIEALRLARARRMLDFMSQLRANLHVEVLGQDTDPHAARP
ncbi:MAG: peptidylprolyl isomerase [Deltaproteobacteria bacterium]|nr:peptidylprolyl isomerase [Deltaproteobacteria bacterium]